MTFKQKKTLCQNRNPRKLFVYWKIGSCTAGNFNLLPAHLYRVVEEKGCEVLFDTRKQ